MMHRLYKAAAITIAVVLALGASPCALASRLDFPCRVVLSWQAGCDLDLYVSGPATHDTTFTLDSRNTVARGRARLQTDRRPGPNSEIATVDEGLSSTYQFYVYDFTARDEGWDDELSRSGARVAVYFGNRLAQSFVVPQEQGNLWTVCSIYRHGMTAIGNMTLEDDPNRVGTSLSAALIPGDILLGAEPESLVPGAWSHVAIYAGDGEVIEAASEDTTVEVSTEVVWEDPSIKWASYLRVLGADEAERERAVSFAREQVSNNCPYDIRFYSKQARGGSWYCSELVWAAYYNATNGKLNLGGTPSWRGVYPWDIDRDPRLGLIGGHYEKRPTRSIRVAFLYVRLVWNHLSSWIGQGLRWLWE